MSEKAVDGDDEDPFETFAISSRPIFSPSEYQNYMKARQRQPKIVYLIERFYHQIRYGCTASVCNTTACRTGQEQRSKGGPYRVPTPSTACALAAYLASVDDPAKHLCPNTPAPKTSPFDVAFPTSQALHSLREYNDPTTVLGAIKIADPNFSRTAEWFAKAEIEEWMNTQALTNTHVNLQQPFPYKSSHPIDTKSFIQTLFSSAAWKLFPFFEDTEHVDVHKTVNAKHLLRGRNALHDPLQTVFAKLQTSSEATEVKSLLSVVSISNPLITKFYEQKNFRHVTDKEGNFSVRDILSTSKDASGEIPHLLQTLSNPSKLMYYGVNPFYMPSGGLQFFQARRSQPHDVLWLELVLLRRQGRIRALDLLQSITSSVKVTGFFTNARQGMPSAIAAHIVCVAIATLSAVVLDEFTNPLVWKIFDEFRRSGVMQFDNYDRPRMVNIDGTQIEFLNQWSLAYEEPAAQYLMKIVLRSFASWSYASSQLAPQTKADGYESKEVSDLTSDFKNRLLMFLVDGRLSPSIPAGQLSLVLLEWARAIFIRSWDGNYLFRWDTDLGASIEFMRWMHQHANDLSIASSSFQMDVLIQRMDYVEGCRDWMNFEVSSSTGHLFDFSWLFPNEAKVVIFRTVNLCRMFAAFVTAVTTYELVKRLEPSIKHSARQLLDKISIAMDKTFIIEIRRDNILRDAFNQLWRRQKRELFRPLRVRMGMDEGEEGVDMGGVQQEFFRLAIADALDPVNGLFAVDERTRMTWFQPMSAAPLYQYTLIGLLFGLAVYNGITLSITFPLAFYRKLLGMENTELHHIDDGWPQLYDGLDSLQRWSEGDVEDVFVRTYTFSFESLGVVHDVEMQKVNRSDLWPPIATTDSCSATETENSSQNSDPEPSLDSSESVMVTNDNREQYINDYIFWLTNKSIFPQFKAFTDGFYLPLQRRALQLFTPEELQLLLEGYNSIDIDGLKATTEYEDGFNATHPKIQEFWEIVDNFSPGQHEKLLEFVTASPRVPVRGMQEVTFIIQRNGVGDDRLPTSMTCFGRLLLPEYSSKAIMAEKLRLALENSTGFGTQ